MIKEENIMTYAEELKAIRYELKLSQTDFGKFLGGVPLRTIQNWEREINSPSDWVMELIRFKVQNFDKLAYPED